MVVDDFRDFLIKKKQKDISNMSLCIKTMIDKQQPQTSVKISLLLSKNHPTKHPTLY